MKGKRHSGDYYIILILLWNKQSYILAEYSSLNDYIHFYDVLLFTIEKVKLFKNIRIFSIQAMVGISDTGV